MFVHFVPDLFLEVAEMIRFKESLDSEGFRKALLKDSVKFGLVKSLSDPTFANARVERDVDNPLNQKTIKIGAIAGINNQGQFITFPQTNNFLIPSDNNWYWVRIKHQYSSIEKGKLTIDASGNVTGVGTEFTKILRSNQNFPSFVRFTNSVGNILEYEVVDITDDTHCVLAHPAITLGGAADFVAESNLLYEIVGTFTEEIDPPTQNKLPFRYDSCLIDLVAEIVPNIRPAYTSGQEFYIARVKVTGGNLVIQDKRTEYWETKGSNKSIEIERTNVNPLVGVEAAKWQNQFNTSDRNIVEIAWGMRSTNWSVDSSQNIVTFFGSSQGGSFKTTSDFTDGDFNGWRLYSSNGKYSKIVNSLKQGGAINLYLDTLDVDNFSLDGGETFTSDLILAVPDADAIEIAFLPEKELLVENDVFNVDDNDKFAFNINTPIGKCLPTVYKDPTCKYIVLYRYKAFKEFTQWAPIVSGEYYTEKSFKTNGALKPSGDRIIYPYTSSSTAAFIQLEISPDSWKRFKETVYKGDIIGVNTITNFTAGQVLDLKVGVDKRYQHIVGGITIDSDIYISISRLNAVPGNEFRLHFDCTTLSLGANKIIICDNYSSGTLIVLKEFTRADAYQMKNQDGGLVFDIVYDELGKWIVYQNYDLGRPYEIISVDGVIDDLFDSTSGLGKVKGLYGYVCCNAARTVEGITVPDLRQRFLIGADAGVTNFHPGDAAGTKEHTVKEENIEEFTINTPGAANTAGVGFPVNGGDSSDATIPIKIGKTGLALIPINHTPQYYAVIKAKKIF